MLRNTNYAWGGYDLKGFCPTFSEQGGWPRGYVLLSLPEAHQQMPSAHWGNYRPELNSYHYWSLTCRLSDKHILFVHALHTYFGEFGGTQGIMIIRFFSNAPPAAAKWRHVRY